MLPKRFELEYLNQVKQLEKELKVSFITTTEEMWLDQGRSQGINQGERAMLLRLLKRKFGVIPEHYMKQIEKANAESLLTWGDRVLECQEIEKIFEA